MNRVQRALIAVSLASFAAGIGVGLAVPAAASALGEPPVENPDHQFVRTFVARFGERFELRPDQIRDLRAILLSFYNDKVRIATSAGYQQWPPELQTELVQAQRRMDRRIEWILDQEQRERYRREVQARSDEEDR